MIRVIHDSSYFEQRAQAKRDAWFTELSKAPVCITCGEKPSNRCWFAQCPNRRAA